MLILHIDLRHPTNQQQISIQQQTTNTTTLRARETTEQVYGLSNDESNQTRKINAGVGYNKPSLNK